MPRKGTRICDNCRHFFSKSNLIAMNGNKGQYCKDCHRKLFPDAKRYKEMSVIKHGVN